ncbi:MAG: SCP2 sterol-binding domain-containing protein [Candidatus Thorarchaeota archaeon]
MIDIPKLFSDEWLDLYKDALNANEAYEKAASWWTGDFIFIVKASGSLDHDVMAYIGLTHGKCTDVKSVAGADEYEIIEPGESASGDKLAVEYTYEADYDTWVEILKGDLDPIRGLLSGKAKIVGEMAKVLKATDAAKELVRTAGMVDTEYY